jgi:hypothetical protein
VSRARTALELALGQTPGLPTEETTP